MVNFALSILSSSGVIFHDQVISLDVDTLQCGMISILSDHENFVASLKEASDIEFKISSGQKKLIKFHGLSSVSFSNSSCTVFVEFCNV